jgi:oligopeptide transport system substrate-binding protein
VKRVTRRQLLVLMSGGTAGLALAACAPIQPPVPTQPPAPKPTEGPSQGPSSTASKPAEAAKPAPAAAPTGTLRVALNGEPPTLDPAVSNDLSSSPLSANLYTTLIATDAAGKLVPRLAQSWTTSQDGTTTTFKLQPNAKFHNGDPIEAKDVKWSWERALTPATKSPTARDTLGDIAGGKDILDGKATELSGVRIVDPHTLEVKVTLPMRGDLLTNVSGWATSIVHRPTVENAGERWFEQKLVGSGPFKLKEWQHNTKVVLEAFPDYFMGSPKVATVELPVVTDPSTELAQYENGELDVGRVPLGDLKRVRADGTLSKELLEFDRAQITYLALNQKAWEPARKLEVRQAIAHAIDRAKLVEQIRFGAGQPSANAVPPGFDGYDPNLKGLEYDPARAKELLAKAGYPGGQGLGPMPLVANPIEPQTRPMSEAIAGMLKENLGIEVQVQTTEFARFTADLNKKDVVPTFYTGWSASILDPNYFLDRLFYSTAGTNRVGFEDPQYDKLIDDANKLPPGEARREAFRKANAYLAEQAPAVMIASTRYVFLKKPSVEGLETTPMSWGMQPFVNVMVKR